MRLHDPQALENAREDLKHLNGDIAFCNDPYEATDGAHALALVTQWQEYRDLDFSRILDRMERPAFLFDGRNLWRRDLLEQMGFTYYGIGC